MNKKLENFWYYHKIKVFVVLFIVVSAIVAIKFTGKKIEPDITFAYVTDGRVLPEDTENDIRRNLEAVIQDANGDRKKQMALISLSGPRVDLEFISGDLQVVLMDGNTLNKYITTGALEQVDEYLSKYNLDLGNNPEVKATVEDGKDQHTYAIPVKNIDFLLDAGFPPDYYYLTICTEKGQNDSQRTKSSNAHAIVDEMLKAQ